MGEYAYGFYASVSKGDTEDPDVKEFLFLGELLGMRTTLQELIDESDPDDPNLHEVLVGRVDMAMVFMGQHLLTFFHLGQDMLAVRGDDAKALAEARAV